MMNHATAVANPRPAILPGAKALAVSALLVIAASAPASIINDGSFDNTISTEGPGDKDADDAAFAGQWASGNNDNGGENRWTDDTSLTVGGVENAANLLQGGGLGGDGTQRSVLMAQVIDNTVSQEKGRHTFSFDVLLAGGVENATVVTWVLGWDAGDTVPVFDGAENDEDPTTNLSLNDAVQIYFETIIDDDASNENASLQAVGGLDPNTTDDTFDTFSTTVDLTEDDSTAYDYVAVVFSGDGNGVASVTDEHVATIDNVSLTLVPEPSSLLLLVLGAAMFLRRRRR
jgi:hypothetical protein